MRTKRFTKPIPIETKESLLRELLYELYSSDLLRYSYSPKDYYNHLIKVAKKDLKENEETFLNLYNEYTYVETYLRKLIMQEVSLKEVIPTKYIRGELAEYTKVKPELLDEELNDIIILKAVEKGLK